MWFKIQLRNRLDHINLSPSIEVALNIELKSNSIIININNMVYILDLVINYVYVYDLNTNTQEFKSLEGDIPTNLYDYSYTYNKEYLFICFGAYIFDTNYLYNEYLYIMHISTYKFNRYRLECQDNHLLYRIKSSNLYFEDNYLYFYGGLYEDNHKKLNSSNLGKINLQSFSLDKIVDFDATWGRTEAFLTIYDGKIFLFFGNPLEEIIEDDFEDVLIIQYNMKTGMNNKFENLLCALNESFDTQVNCLNFNYYYFWRWNDQYVVLLSKFKNEVLVYNLEDLTMQNSNESVKNETMHYDFLSNMVIHTNQGKYFYYISTDDNMSISTVESMTIKMKFFDFV